MVKEIIANSELIYTDTPKTNKGQKMFSKILVLVAAVRGIGWAKLTIGKYNDKAAMVQAPYCQYCIQHLSIHTLKNKIGIPREYKKFLFKASRVSLCH